jgi:hypothetical protein
VGSQVLLIEVAAGFLYGTGDATGDLTFIEGAGPVLGDGSNRAGEVRLVEELPGLGRPVFEK